MIGKYINHIFLLTTLYERRVSSVTLPPVPAPEGVLKGEGISSEFGVILLPAPAIGDATSRTGWTVTVDSFEPGNEAIKVLDGDQSSIWHTEWTPDNIPLPHTITIDMKNVYNINGISYLPRQDGISNGNIGQHQIFVSRDGTNFGSPVAFGTYIDDSTQKITSFETIPARYLRIIAITEAGGRGPWTSAAEINIYSASSFTPPPNGLGRWGPTIDFPLVPVAAAVDHDTGKVIAWSSFSPSTFTGGSGKTVTATYDPASGTVSQRTITNTGHDMFCPGIAMDVHGRVIVTGGNDSNKASIYDPGSDTWSSAANLFISRGYQSSVTCSDGRMFTIGGSWSGGQGNKNGEIYDPVANTATSLPNCPVAPMLTSDVAGVYRADNHGWLFGWKNGYVFQAGPSKAMNWYDTKGTGGYTAAGVRASDSDSMCGNAVMYDAVQGLILTVGGSPNYSGSEASTAAHIIRLGAPGQAPSINTINVMYSERVFANSVVLPNGQVFITGGQTYGNPFSDEHAILTPEMWNPQTTHFVQMASNSIPRTYHSIALLLLDGTVLSGGGGLCDTCSTNHFDAQIYTPQYLLNPDGSYATRPNIFVSERSITVGGTLNIIADSEISDMSLIRLGSTTHTVNTDQRRIPLSPSVSPGQSVPGLHFYFATVPNDPGIIIPGYWMLFALNRAGVPSIAKTIHVTLH